MSIKGKIRLIVSTSILGISLVSGGLSYSLALQNNVSEEQQKVATLTIDSANLNFLFSQIRKNEQLFLRTPSDEQEQRVFDSIDTFKQTVEAFAGYSFVNTSSAASLQAISEEIVVYEKEFTSLASFYRTVGFTQNDGYRSELVRSDDTFAVFIKRYGGSTLYTGYMELSQHANNYMIEKNDKYYDLFNQSYTAYVAQVKTSKMDASDKTLTLTKLEKYQSHFSKIREVYVTIDTLTKNFQETATNVETLSNELSEDLLGTQETLQKQGDALKEKLRVTVALMVLVVAVVVSLISLVVIRSIVRSIERLKQNAALIGSGDLRHHIEIETMDEMGELSISFNDMADKMNTSLRTMSDHSTQLHANSEELTANAEETLAISNEVVSSFKQIQKGAEEQAVRLIDGTHLLQSNLVKIDQIVKKSDAIQQEFSIMKVQEDTGREIIAKLVETTDSLFAFLGSFAEKVRVSTENTKKIQHVMTVIEELSQKTNLLALNASIEAARAGEAGKGFMVVANEVKKLAEDSKKETVIVSTLIKEIEETMQELVHHSNTFDAIQSEQANSVAQTNNVFSVIDTNIDKTSTYFNEILTDINSIHAFSQEIEKSIAEVAHISQEFAVATNQSLNANEEQKGSIERINDIAVRLYEISNGLEAESRRFLLQETKTK